MKRMLFSAAVIAAVGFGALNFVSGAAFGQANEDEVATAMPEILGTLAAAARATTRGA